MKIGVISDTHGLLRPEVAPALAGVDHILHLGDVGKISILRELETIAPVTAIRGNIDREVVLLGGQYLYLLHDLNTLHLDPAAAKFAAVLFGHTHAPTLYKKKGVLYFNPGSCGPRRFNLPISLGRLTIEADGDVQAELISLEV